ncbi:MAG: hypothetical protein H6843_16375 [Rhodospirillaceae bacterium]|nr:hypothetical protein [Rhodospirillaceae bacterium]
MAGRVAALLLAVVTLALAGCAVTDYERLYGAWTGDGLSVSLERGGTFSVREAQALFDAPFVGNQSSLDGRYTVDTEMDLSEGDEPVESVVLRFNLLHIGSYSVERMLGVLEQEDTTIRSRVGNTVYDVQVLALSGDTITLYSEEFFGGEVTLTRIFRVDDILGTNVLVFVGLTLVLFGGAAFMAGQALANGWKTPLTGLFYCALLSFADMFLVYGLFDGDGTLVSGYIIRLVVLSTIFLTSYRVTQARKMVTQYPWVYERQGLFGWRTRSGTGAE